MNTRLTTNYLRYNLWRIFIIIPLVVPSYQPLPTSMRDDTLQKTYSTHAGNLLLTTVVTWSQDMLHADFTLTEKPLSIDDPYTFARKKIAGYIQRAEEIKAELSTFAPQSVEAFLYIYDRGRSMGSIDAMVNDLRSKLQELDEWYSLYRQGKPSAYQVRPVTADDVAWIAYVNYAGATGRFANVFSEKAAGEVAALFVDQYTQKQPLWDSYHAAITSFERQYFDIEISWSDLERIDCGLRSRYMPLEKAIDDGTQERYAEIMDEWAQSLTSLVGDLAEVKDHVTRTRGERWQEARSSAVYRIADEVASMASVANNPWLAYFTIDNLIFLDTIMYKFCEAPHSPSRELSPQEWVKRVASLAKEPPETGTATRLDLKQAALLSPEGEQPNPQPLQGTRDAATFILPNGTCDMFGWKLNIQGQDANGDKVTFLISLQDEGKPEESDQEETDDLEDLKKQVDDRLKGRLKKFEEDMKQMYPDWKEEDRNSILKLYAKSLIKHGDQSYLRNFHQWYFVWAGKVEEYQKFSSPEDAMLWLRGAKAEHEYTMSEEQRFEDEWKAMVELAEKLIAQRASNEGWTKELPDTNAALRMALGLVRPESAELAKSLTKIGEDLPFITDQILDFVPLIGEAKGFIEAFLGHSLLSGRELEPWERALGFVLASKAKKVKLLKRAHCADKLREVKGELKSLEGLYHTALKSPKAGAIFKRTSKLDDFLKRPFNYLESLPIAARSKDALIKEVGGGKYEQIMGDDVIKIVVPETGEVQIWAKPSFSDYRKGWEKAFPNNPIPDGVQIDHIYSKNLAEVQKFEYVRLTPLDSSANASWGWFEQRESMIEGWERGLGDIRPMTIFEYLKLSEIMSKKYFESLRK